MPRRIQRYFPAAMFERIDVPEQRLGKDRPLNVLFQRFLALFAN